MIGPSGVLYEKHSGKIYVSKQNGNPTQGYNVAELQNDGTLRVLGYTQRNTEKLLFDGVLGVMKSYGWFDHVISRKLAEEDEISTCAICGYNYHENDVNMIDFEVDVCVVCEPKYRLRLGKEGV